MVKPTYLIVPAFYVFVHAVTKDGGGSEVKITLLTTWILVFPNTYVLSINPG